MTGGAWGSHRKAMSTCAHSQVGRQQLKADHDILLVLYPSSCNTNWRPTKPHQIAALVAQIRDREPQTQACKAGELAPQRTMTLLLCRRRAPRHPRAPELQQLGRTLVRAHAGLATAWHAACHKMGCQQAQQKRLEAKWLRKIIYPVIYSLVTLDKRQQIMFFCLPVTRKHAPVAAASRAPT